MDAFAYARPRTVDEAVELLTVGDAAVLAGGTDLLSLLKDGVERPRRLVSLLAIPELRRIEEAPQGLVIGATATLAELRAHPRVVAEYPALAQAIDGVRAPQIRNMGTVGGDLLQRPRCWYYRSGFGLLAMRDGESMVVAGDNRYHAIFDDGPAHFVSASSLAPALVALGAKVRLRAGGEREVTLASLYRAPRRDGEREVDVEANEVMTAVVLPPVHGARSATYEVRERESLDWPLAAAAVVLWLRGGNVREARVVLGHVAPTPRNAAEAAAALVGGPLTEERAAAAGAAAVAGAKPLRHNAYKVQLASVAVKRAALRAAGTEV
ncbi:MAG TPA: FAD binding domain-containing protein [Thermoanaerobaculia bacterium]|nr:FAD binding domain-containing protein [Thermoanaerobaculia bacterium]